MKIVLKQLSECVREVVNFGTHILKWDVEKKRDGSDRHTPSVFLRNSIELADAISMLIEKSSIDPAKILVRTLMESNFNLLYMIEKDEQTRAYYFLVCRLNKDIRSYRQYIKEDEISKDFVSKFKKQQPDFDVEKYCDPLEVQKIIQQKESLLTESPYAEINLEYHRTCTKREKRNNDPNWYSLNDGPENFGSLCKYLNNSLLYENQYRRFSESVHSKNVMSGFAISGPDQADLLQIRNFKDCREVFHNSVDLLLKLYIGFIKMRLPEKQRDFDDWLSRYSIEFTKVDFGTRFQYMG